MRSAPGCEDRDEAHRRIAEKQCRHHADQRCWSHRKDQEQRLKLCSWIIRIVAMANSIIGATAAIGPCASALDSTAPPISTL